MRGYTFVVHQSFFCSVRNRPNSKVQSPRLQLNPRSDVAGCVTTAFRDAQVWIPQVLALFFGHRHLGGPGSPEPLEDHPQTVLQGTVLSQAPTGH